MAKKFGDVLDWYLSNMARLGLSICRQRTCVSLSRRLKTELGQLYLSHGQVRKGQRLDRMAVREFRLAMEHEGKAHSTIKAALALGHVAIRAAYREKDWDLPNPFKDMAYGLKPNKRNREVTAGEEKRLFLCLKQPFRDMAEVMLECGFRPGEVRNLTWDRIEDNRVVFRAGVDTTRGGQKSGRQATAWLTERALELVNKQPRVSPYVFHIDGGRVTHGQLLAAWHLARGQTGIAHCTPHDMRRTWGRRLRRGGTDLDAIQAQSRITTRAILESVYATLDEDKAMGAAKGAKVALS